MGGFHYCGSCFLRSPKDNASFYQEQKVETQNKHTTKPYKRHKVD